MPKKAKKQLPPDDDEIFQKNYMLALNEKFKLRSQLGALRNQLEDMYARNERMADANSDKRDELARGPRQPQSPSPTSPAKTVVQTATPTVVQLSSAEPEEPEEDDEEEKAIEEYGEEEEPDPEPIIEYIDEIVIVKRTPGVRSGTAPAGYQHYGYSVPELSDELERLRKRYKDITFYAVLLILLLFAVMIMKEMRLLVVRMTHVRRPCDGVELPPPLKDSNTMYVYDHQPPIMRCEGCCGGGSGGGEKLEPFACDECNVAQNVNGIGSGGSGMVDAGSVSSFSSFTPVP